MAEIDFTSQSGGVMTIAPGNEYLIFRSVSTLLNVKWEFVGDAPFQHQVKGIRLLFGFIPNPFNSPWFDAQPNYQGKAAGWYGNRGDDTHFTLYLLVRTNSPSVRLRFTGDWSKGGGISFPF